VEDSPRTAIDADYDQRTTGNGQYLNMTVVSGQVIETERLRLAVTGAEVAGDSSVASVTGTPLASQTETELTAGADLTLHTGHFDTGASENVDLSGTTVQLIWEPPSDGEPVQSQTIWRWEYEG